MCFDVKADTNQTRQIYSQEELTLALRCLCDTRALRARRDYKPCGSALREESICLVQLAGIAEENSTVQRGILNYGNICWHVHHLQLSLLNCVELDFCRFLQAQDNPIVIFLFIKVALSFWPVLPRKIVQYVVLGPRLKVINLNILPESSRNELKYSLKIAFTFFSIILKFQVPDINILLGVRQKATVFDGPWSANVVLGPRLR